MEKWINCDVLNQLVISKHPNSAIVLRSPLIVLTFRMVRNAHIKLSVNGWHWSKAFDLSDMQKAINLHFFVFHFWLANCCRRDFNMILSRMLFWFDRDCFLCNVLLFFLPIRIIEICSIRRSRDFLKYELYKLNALKKTDNDVIWRIG